MEQVMEGLTNISETLENLEAQCVHLSADFHAGGRAGGTPRSGDPGPSLYLEQSSNSVTEEEREQRKQWIELCPKRCGSFFCPRCCLRKGIELKKSLKKELPTWKSVMMLTLTLDPENFSSPQEGYEHVTKNRCIAKMMQTLFRWGLVLSRKYVAVIEWQKDTEQSHWHVLIEASFVPHDKICEAWNRTWSGSDARVAIGRPGLGAVRFSAPKFAKPEDAAGYVSAYLTKCPEHGYPEWVLAMPCRRIHRFQTSRYVKLGGDEVPKKKPVPREEAEKSEDACVSANEVRTVGELVAGCEGSCVAFWVHEEREAGGVTRVVRQFAKMVPIPWMEAVLAAPPLECVPGRKVAVYPDLNSLNAIVR
jgi:hypothetical protein